MPLSRHLHGSSSDHLRCFPQIVGRLKGRELEGRTYEPLFPYYESLKAQGAFKVVCDGYVTATGGTGVVHQAPAFGEDDYRVALANGA